jgi:hypothetical protein
MRTVQVDRKLDYIPASVEWADFDPTALANAVALFDGVPGFALDEVRATFAKFVSDWRAKRTGALDWANYTAYEIRIVGALIRLGDRESALELLRFFLRDRRPLHWNQWPEITWRDPESPGHIGDVPHTWIAAEYLLVVRTLFAYETAEGDALVVGAGLAPEWLDGAGVKIEAMPTAFGPLCARIWREPNGIIHADFEGGIRIPSGGIVFVPPLGPGSWQSSINGAAAEPISEGRIPISQLPASLLLSP